MKRAFRWLAGVILFLPTAWFAAAQNTHGPAVISKITSNLFVSWTGTGTLQSSPIPPGPWQDILEARSPFGTPPTNAQQFFHVMSRWSTRANLIEANSEMGVAELNGKVYILGGYPASRITVNTVQVYDSAANTWQLTTPLLLGVNHPMPAVANGKIFVIGGQTDTGSACVNNVQEFDPVTANWTLVST